MPFPADASAPPNPSPESRTSRLGSIRARYSRGFWTFFLAAFFYDFGFGLFFFLFNLYLTDLHFNEKILGILTGTLTFGNVCGTIPMTAFARRVGLKRPLLLCFIAAPLLCILRTFLLSPPAQITLAFLTGVVMSAWPICFSPAIAQLTEDRNRVSGFSITFATGIGLGTLAGLAGGYLPELLEHTGHGSQLVTSMRTVIEMACVVALLGVWPIARLGLGAPAGAPERRRIRIFHPFLLWFLPPFVVWNVVTGSVPPFAAVYLQQHLGMALRPVGVVFSISQLLQFAAVLLAPLLYRRWGRIAGVAIAQALTAVALLGMGASRATSSAIPFFLAFCGMQWTTGPGIYSFLMDQIPEEERSTASAIQNLAGAICQAATAAITGGCIVRFGYPNVFFGNAAFALAASLLFLLLLGRRDQRDARVPSARAPLSGSVV